MLNKFSLYLLSVYNTILYEHFFNISKLSKKLLHKIAIN